jgi:MFS transporter, AAHS family, 4-hydroxybenzoate transporter
VYTRAALDEPFSEAGHAIVESASQTLTVSELIDQWPIGRFQIWVVALCGLVLVLDGFDGQTITFLAPSIADSTHIPIHSFGPIFSASLFGLMIAAMTTGPIADRWGRKWPVIFSTLSFSVFSLLTPRASSFHELFLLRFLTGLGLGGAMPNVVALASEYVPKRLLSVVVTVLFTGMPFGGVICGFLSSRLITTWGWQWVFYIGGIVPFAIALLLVTMLPESVQFLAVRGKAPRRVERILSRMAPEMHQASLNLGAVSVTHAHTGVPVKYLFTEGRGVGTMLLWFPYFMNLLLIYFIGSWLPAMLKEAGMAGSAAVTVSTFFSVGGVVACLVEGQLMNRCGARTTLLIEYAVASVFVAALAMIPRSFALVAPVTFISGFVIIGAQGGLNALAARFYPTSIRSTGVGWALGVGRLGSIVGPLMGGVLLSVGWKPEQMLLSGTIFAVLAWLSILLSNRVTVHPTAYSGELNIGHPDSTLPPASLHA